MARNSSGTHSLPAGNPVVNDTTITPTWANGTLGDISTELTDSLSRSGKGGMTAPLKTADGTVGAPAWSFSSEATSGWYRSAAGVIRAAILGTYRLLLNATGLQVNGSLETSAGIVMGGAGTGAGQWARPNLPSVGQQVSSSSGAYSNAAATEQDVTNLTVTITTTGRPVVLAVQPDDTGGDLLIGAESADITASVYFYLHRAGTPIALWRLFSSITGATANAFYPGTSLFYVDGVGAGTYTYKITVLRGNVNVSACRLTNAKLVAFEL